MAREMGIKEYKESLEAPLKQATICLLVKDNQVLLAMKKRGFGVGKWNGVGGKPNENEDIKDAAVRETQEEIGVTPINPREVATLNFYSPSKPNFNQQVKVYKVDKWEGEPKESEEMAPKWFDKDEIPYDSMFEDDKHWLPLVMDDRKIEADFLFGEDHKLVDFKISEY